MPTPPRRSPRQSNPADDTGYEVVDDQPKRMARVVRAAPVDDPVFDVVDEEAPLPKKKSKRSIVAVEEDDDDTVQSSRHRDDDDETEEQPRKKKKRRSIPLEEADRTNNSWWILPVVLIVVGIALSLGGAMGIASGKKQAIDSLGTGILLTITLVQFVVSIPVIIVALVIGGKLFGIEYGSPLMALTNITAIGSMIIGLTWLLSWIGLWDSAIHCITFITAFSLFMTLFELDSWEVWVSVICIEVITIASKILIFLFIVAALMRGGRGGDNGAFDRDDPPQRQQKNDRNDFNQPGNRFNDPDDDN